MLQIGRQHIFRNSVVFRGLDLPDGVPGQWELLGYRPAPAVAANGVHHVPGLIIDFKHCSFQQRPGRQAIGRVVVRGLFDELNLRCDRRVFPDNLRSLTSGHINGFELGIRDIALVVQFPQVIAATAGEVVDVDISPLVAHIFTDGIFPTVVQQEGHTVNALAGGGGNLVDQDTAERLVGNGQLCGLSIFHSEIVWSVIQLVAISRLGFNGVIVPVLQSQEHSAVCVCGNSVHQSVIHPPDLKGHIGDSDLRVVCVGFDNLHAAHGLVVKVE